jgi:hypothetical protein
MATRADALKGMAPDLVADVVLYSTGAGGKTIPALPGFGCPCMVSKTMPLLGHDARLILHEPLHPGQARRIGFVFLHRESVNVMLEARHFFLWEGRFIGEATVVESKQGPSLSAKN